MAGLLSVLLLFPRIMSALRPLERQNDLALYAFPPIWFLGLYETVLGRTEPVFRSLAGIAVAALGAVLAALFPLYGVFWGWRVASLQLLFDATLSLILMELLLLNFRKIPFTCTYVPGKAHITTRWIFYWMAFSAYAYSMASLEYAIFESAASQVIFFGAAFSVLGGLIAYRNHLLDRGFTLVFEEEPEPVVQTLNLSA